MKRGLDKMRIDILSLFPEMFDSPFNESIIKRAIDSKLLNIFIHNFRDYAHDKHHTVDDYPYGGGAGMVLKPEPLFEAVDSVKKEIGHIVCHQVAQELSSKGYG